MLEKEKKSDGTDDTFPVIPAEPLLSLPSGGLLTTQHRTFLSHTLFTYDWTCIFMLIAKFIFMVQEESQM